MRKDPFRGLVQAIDSLTKTAQASLAGDLDRISLALAEELERPSFGTCADCDYLTRDRCPVKRRRLYQCDLLEVSLKDKELSQICVNYAPG